MGIFLVKQFINQTPVWLNVEHLFSNAVFKPQI